MEATPQSNLTLLSPTVNGCSANMLSIEATSASSTTTMMSAPISTNINILAAAPTRGTSHLVFNSLVSVDRSQQQTHHHKFHVGEQRALQLALELTAVGVNETATIQPINNRKKNNNLTSQQVIAELQQEQLNQKIDISANKNIQPTVSAATNGFCETNINGLISNNGSRNSSISFNNFTMPAPLLPTTIEDRSKKSQNMTECVPVPSSEHVAEIVGRQGCKIKALRAKTNTYIKTPVRGEEPVFVVTGRKEDVAKAKREILSAAEHFSLIRATRKPLINNTLDETINNSLDGNNCGTNGFRKAPPGPPSIPGQVTIQVRVPYRVVGLVVGPKGATIKHIQHQTQTYIVTPSRDKEPIFEVTGLPDNVQSARKQIEAHIALRTGTLPTCVGNNNSNVLLTGTTNDVLAVHNLNILSQILNQPTVDSDLLTSLYKTERMRSALDYDEEGVGADVSDMQYFELPNKLSKINFNMNSLETNAVEQQTYMKLLQTDNTQLPNWAQQMPDYVNDLSNGGDAIKTTNNMLTDLAPPNQQQTTLQQQENMLPTTQYTPNLEPLKNQPLLFGNLGCYIQTINISNNTTALDYKTQATTCVSSASTTGVPQMKYSNSNTHNSNALSSMARSCSSASSTASSKSANNSGCGSSSRPELVNIWKSLGDSLDIDEGIGDSPNIWTLPTPLATLTGSHCSPSTSISPTDSLLGDSISAHNHLNNAIHVNSVVLNETQHERHNVKNLLQQQQQQQQDFKNDDAIHTLINNASAQQRRDCLICKSKEITAVLVPCGHNMFCMECANRICELGDAVCPVCSLSVYHAMRILA